MLGNGKAAVLTSRLGMNGSLGELVNLLQLTREHWKADWHGATAAKEIQNGTPAKGNADESGRSTRCLGCFLTLPT